MLIYKYTNNYTYITKYKYSYKYRNNYTSVSILIHVSIPWFLYSYH